MIEHRHPTSATQKHVLTASGNQCAFPGCPRMIFDLEHETLVGTVAHIKARSEKGRRFDLLQSEEDNMSFRNLIAMCAEHSKIIDGPKWSDFSVTTLTTWKKEHEELVSNSSDRSWIKPPNSITKMTAEGERLHFSYWIDRFGRPKLFSPQQLAVINTMMYLNLMILQVANLPERLVEAKNATVETILQQDWGKFKIEKSVIADLFMLFAMAGNVTFAEFLGFVVQGNDATPLIQNGARRIDNLIEGGTDPIIKNWFKSDQLAK